MMFVVMITSTSVFFASAVMVIITFASISTIALSFLVCALAVFFAIAVVMMMFVVMITSTSVFFTITVVMMFMMMVMFVMVVTMATTCTSLHFFIRKFNSIEHTSDHKVNNLIIGYFFSCHVFNSRFEFEKVCMSFFREFECSCHGNIG